MTTPDPATPAALARVDDTARLQAQETELAQLDDDDLVEIGRAVTGTSPRRGLRLLSILGATLAAPLLTIGVGANGAVALAVSGVGVVVALLSGRSDARKDLADVGIGDDLAAELAVVAAGVSGAVTD